MPVTRLRNQRFWMTYIYILCLEFKTFVNEAKSGGLAPGRPQCWMMQGLGLLVILTSARDDGETFLFCNQRSLETQTSGLGSGSDVADGQNVITSMTQIFAFLFCVARALTR